MSDSVRAECHYCTVHDVKDDFGEQWTSGVKYDEQLTNAIEQASRLIDLEMGWGVCHYAAGDLVASARLFDTISGTEMQISRCLDNELNYTAATISFTAPNTIGDTANGLAGFLTGDIIAVAGSASNDGLYTITTGGVAATIVVAETLTNEAAGASVTISRPAVEVDETATGVYVPWAGDVDYITWPYNETYFTRLIIKTGAAKVFTTGQQLLRITANWGGHSTPPAVVKKACIITVARWFKRALQAYQDTGAIEELGQLMYTKALDPDVQEILRVLPRRANWGE